MTRVIPGIAVICSLIGCATLPENIKPQYVSEVPYQTWTCEQLIQEKIRLDGAINTVSDQQRTTREHDVGWILLFGLPLSQRRRPDLGTVRTCRVLSHAARNTPVPVPFVCAGLSPITTCDANLDVRMVDAPALTRIPHDLEVKACRSG
jgi:hypothetical protein